MDKEEIASHLKTAITKISNGEFKTAELYLDLIIDSDSEIAQTYFLKMLVSLKARNMQELSDKRISICENALFKRALECATPEYAEKLNNVSRKIDTMIPLPAKPVDPPPSESGSQLPKQNPAIIVAAPVTAGEGSTIELNELPRDKLGVLLSEASREAADLAENSDRIEYTSCLIRSVNVKPKGFGCAALAALTFPAFLLTAAVVKVVGDIFSINIENINSPSAANLFITVVLFGGAVGLSFLASHFYKKHNTKKIDTTVADLRSELSELSKRREHIIENIKFLIFIPPNYRYAKALSTMAGYTVSQTADSWKECAAKFDEQEHRWKMEENSELAVELNKQQLAATNAMQEDVRLTKWAVIAHLWW